MQPFGKHALPPFLERLRGFGTKMPRRWMASGLRRVIYALREQPYDVTVFGSQRARLYPKDNRTEKKVFTAPQFWDVAERKTLADRIAASRDFVFVDAGANVGMYSLAVRAMCQSAHVPLTCLSIEPDPVNGSRLADNVALNDASDVQTAAIALSDGEGTAHFRTGALINRGEAQVVASAGRDTVSVPMKPLADVVRDHGISRIDALKIDIEGLEERVLSGLFSSAPETLFPKMIIIETVHSGSALSTLIENAGYVETARHGINSIYDRVR